VVEINVCLNKFPPFMANQALPENKILDIAKFAIPNMGQKTLILQGFDPAVYTINKFTKFCERLNSLRQSIPMKCPIKILLRRQVVKQSQVTILQEH